MAAKHPVIISVALNPGFANNVWIRGTIGGMSHGGVITTDNYATQVGVIARLANGDRENSTLLILYGSSVDGKISTVIDTDFKVAGWTVMSVGIPDDEIEAAEAQEDGVFFRCLEHIAKLGFKVTAENDVGSGLASDEFIMAIAENLQRQKKHTYSLASSLIIRCLFPDASVSTVAPTFPKSTTTDVAKGLREERKLFLSAISSSSPPVVPTAESALIRNEAKRIVESFVLRYPDRPPPTIEEMVAEIEKRHAEHLVAKSRSDEAVITEHKRLLPGDIPTTATDVARARAEEITQRYRDTAKLNEAEDYAELAGQKRPVFVAARTRLDNHGDWENQNAQIALINDELDRSKEFRSVQRSGSTDTLILLDNGNEPTSIQPLEYAKLVEAFSFIVILPSARKNPEYRALDPFDGFEIEHGVDRSVLTQRSTPLQIVTRLSTFLNSVIPESSSPSRKVKDDTRSVLGKCKADDPPIDGIGWRKWFLAFDRLYADSKLKSVTIEYAGGGRRVNNWELYYPFKAMIPRAGNKLVPYGIYWIPESERKDKGWLPGFNGLLQRSCLVTVCVDSRGDDDEGAHAVVKTIEDYATDGPVYAMISPSVGAAMTEANDSIIKYYAEHDTWPTTKVAIADSDDDDEGGYIPPKIRRPTTQSPSPEKEKKRVTPVSEQVMKEYALARSNGDFKKFAEKWKTTIRELGDVVFVGSDGTDRSPAEIAADIRGILSPTV